jgi:hypothetical protein
MPTLSNEFPLQSSTHQTPKPRHLGEHRSVSIVPSVEFTNHSFERRIHTNELVHGRLPQPIGNPRLWRNAFENAVTRVAKRQVP